MSLLVTVPTDRLAANIGAVPDEVDLRVWDMKSPAPAQHIDIVVPPYMGSTGPLGALEELSVGLVQSQSIGYDGVAELLPGERTVHVTITPDASVQTSPAVADDSGAAPSRRICRDSPA